ncbi:hypothetical protein GCM10023185_20030 [Hymenobacter saemangeumensis]|uniref:DUF1049 domain-containing protein n=1 Tax=Hymenobacter saemangeumensis TaxID=1084522 RepID=A0ABP8IDF5_9BACT
MPPLPYARQLVGGMLLLCGVMLAMGLALRVGVRVYLWNRAGAGAIDARWLAMLLLLGLGAVAAMLLAAYGWRLLRGARLRSGPGGKPIL